ncbi:unnamed protein product, partial [Discosporangium mesarthrocarpum]
PEWALSFLLRALDTYRPLLEEHIQPLLDVASLPPSLAGSSGGGGGGGGGGDGDHESEQGPPHGRMDCLSYCARAMVMLARRWMRAVLGHTLADASLMAHTIEEALALDRWMDHEVGYGDLPVRFPGEEWPRCSEVFAQTEERFLHWVAADKQLAESKLKELAEDTKSWGAVVWTNGPQPPLPTTHAARGFATLFHKVTSRYQLLREPSKQLFFLQTVQKPLLEAYYRSVYMEAKTCRLHTLFRDSLETGAFLEVEV